MTSENDISIGAISCKFGDQQRTPESISNIDALCDAISIENNFEMLGCRNFWKMTKPLETYIHESIVESLRKANILPRDVDYLVMATTDANLAKMKVDTVRNILVPLGLIRCQPILVSMQQCASSFTALNWACELIRKPQVKNIVMCLFDFVDEDQDRVKQFALFGDAVTTCVIRRSSEIGFKIRAYSAGTDFSGLQGKDDFNSRKELNENVVKSILEEDKISLDSINRVFATNLYDPIGMFNASIMGLNRKQTYTKTLASHAHCGNCDWMMNLAHYIEFERPIANQYYIIQASAPGYFAASLLQYT